MGISSSFFCFGILLLGLLCCFSSSSSSSLSSSYDYRDALSKTLLYFETQRSGRLPYDQRVTWRHHSALTDGLQQGVDLVGGYYDAGDHVKFGLPMAFTVTMLAWSVLHFRHDIAQASELTHALQSIKWGTDYFLKAHTSPTTLWAQVGDGETDHYCWQRAEDMTTSRQAFKIDQDHPGSDLAGETSAAMAASSIVFRQTDPHYSTLLLYHARQLFEFGDRYRGCYHESVDSAKGYYPSVSGYKDELLWSALWLYKATGEDYYLTYIIHNAVSFGGITWAIHEFSWDVKYAGIQILAATLPIDVTKGKNRHIFDEYRRKGEHYLCACLNMNGGEENNVRRTPGGLLYIRRWNNMQYVSTAAFLATVYSDQMMAAGGERMRCGGGEGVAEVGVERVMGFVRGQVECILGRNPKGMSYVVGYGEKHPKRVHHRGGSMKGYKESREFIGCTEGYDEWHGRDEDNPNVVVGALVGGPGEDDEFRDERWNYMQTEACTYNSAPLVGVLARFHSFSLLPHL